MTQTAAPQTQPRASKVQQPQETQQYNWMKIVGLIMVGFFASRLLVPQTTSIQTPIAAASLSPVAAPAPQPVATPAPQPVATPAPQPTQSPAPVIQQAPQIVTQPVVIQQQAPQVTVLKPQETIIIQKSYPNRTIVIESSPTVLVQ